MITPANAPIGANSAIAANGVEQSGRWVPCGTRPTSSFARCRNRPVTSVGGEIREYQEEFETGTQEVAGTSTIRRPDAVSLDYLTAFCFGPVALNDTSRGAHDRVWRVRATGSQVFLARGNEANTVWEPETLLFSYSGAPILEVDLSFGQNAQPMVVCERAGSVWLYWFDPVLQGTVFADLGPGRNPRTLLDNPRDTVDSDVVIFYVSDAADALAYRHQRDRWAAQFLTPLTGVATTYLEEVARARDGRLHVYTSHRDLAAGRYSIQALESALYPYVTPPEEVAASHEVLAITLEDIPAAYDLGEVSVGGAVILAASTEAVFQRVYHEQPFGPFTLPPDDPEDPEATETEVPGDAVQTGMPYVVFASITSTIAFVAHSQPNDDRVAVGAPVTISAALTRVALVHYKDEEEVDASHEIVSFTLDTA
jgi:hypothetical protein